MRMSLVAATALAGSLLIPLLMLGSAQAVTNAPVLKSVVSTNPDGPVTLVREGGGGFGGHMGGFGGGGGFGGHMGGFVAIWVAGVVVPALPATCTVVLALPIGTGMASISIASITSTTSTIDASSTTPSLLASRAGGATAMAAAAIGYGVRPLSLAVPIGGLAIKPAWATTEAAESQLS